MAAENHVLIISQEFLNRIMVGLGEVASKFAIPVIQDIEIQVKSAESGAKDWIASIESHLTGIKIRTTPPSAPPEQPPA